MANENDAVRDTILRHLYEVHRHARGPRAVACGIRDLHGAMKDKGFKQPIVNSNLDYLIQKGWVKPVEERKTFTTSRGTTQESVAIKYKISDVGIDRLEGASAYRREEHFSRINITNVKGVTVVGTGNIVNASMTDLSEALNRLEAAVQGSRGLPEEEKLNVIADIGTIHAQLSKPNPDASIVKQAWTGVETAVTAAGFVELANRVKELLLPLFGA